MTQLDIDPAAPAAGQRDVSALSSTAQRVRDLSVERWGADRAVELMGSSPAFLAMLAKVEKIAHYREPVLLTGESGAGKELVAQALYLLGQPRGRPYVSVNCPQFQEGNLTVSELFGHQKGSFTGAIGDHTGAFEQAHGGAIFLDEIADLQPAAQAMLLRALATGEFRPIGATRARTVDVRVIAATNRSLNRLMLSGEFRHDLFFRLRHFHIDVPPLRTRGDDWKQMMEACLQRLCRKYGAERQLSPASERLLSSYTWPGNVRQLIGMTTSGYAMADGLFIEPKDLAAQMDDADLTQFSPPPSSMPSMPETSTNIASTAPLAAPTMFEQLVARGDNFWTAVYQRFMARDLNRGEVRSFIRAGLDATQGNYRRLVELLRLPGSDYQRFMDFLRHHDLKP